MKLWQGNVLYTCLSFCSRGGSVCHTPPGSQPPILGKHPPWADIPPRQTPPSADTPLGRHPPQQTPPLPSALLRYTPPLLPSVGLDTPPCTVHAGIRSTSRWYASYWNAFLLHCAEVKIKQWFFSEYHIFTLNINSSFFIKQFQWNLFSSQCSTFIQLSPWNVVCII